MSVRRGTVMWSLLALLGTGSVIADQAAAQVPAVGTGITHVRRIDPRSGPAGTTIRVQADGLPVDALVFVALAAVHSGYEVGMTTQTNGRGELVAVLTVPDRHENHWDHSEIVVVLTQAESRMLAMSDPFHITNDEGFVQRTGVIEMVGAGCPVLQSFDGVAYALVGSQAPSLAASAGHQLQIEGPIADGTCGLQNAIEVREIHLAPQVHPATQ